MNVEYQFFIISLVYNTGICSAFPVTLAGVLVTRYFDRYQTTAMGVFLSGPAVVSATLTLVMQVSSEHSILSFQNIGNDGVMMISIFKC